MSAPVLRPSVNVRLTSTRGSRCASALGTPGQYSPFLLLTVFFLAMVVDTWTHPLPASLGSSRAVRAANRSCALVGNAAADGVELVVAAGLSARDPPELPEARPAARVTTAS